MGDVLSKTVLCVWTQPQTIRGPNVSITTFLRDPGKTPRDFIIIPRCIESLFCVGTRSAWVAFRYSVVLRPLVTMRININQNRIILWKCITSERLLPVELVSCTNAQTGTFSQRGVPLWFREIQTADGKFLSAQPATQWNKWPLSQPDDTLMKRHHIVYNIFPLKLNSHPGIRKKNY